ncbi:MAG: clostripain-related cysteine peptidase [Clostridia bacterium]|nr:clostripain-related cysteine peptidase [Clostridia bacterium]
MDRENRPHGREKKVGSGSANVGKGKKVDTGSRPVGSGGRPNGGQGNRDNGFDGAPQRALPKLSFKTILILGAIILLAIIILPKLGLFGGGGNSVLSSVGGAGSSVTHQAWDGVSNNGNTNNNASTTAIDTNVSGKARDRYYTPETGDTVTIMVYMCGTDLESKYGMATSDLTEMANANIADNVNLIVETGGCSKWKTTGISNSCNQIYKVVHGKLIPVEKDFGNNPMTDHKNLTKFIQYCTKNYSADRYMLILWDHGGGSLTGFGYDEKNKNSGSMTLANINTALKNAKCKFDFIGFDACLMATLETDLVCNSYADYMIASEESEPGTGWYYTNWLNQLSQDTSTPTVELAKTIIDNFVSASCAQQPNAQVTLSVVDLAELDGTIPDALRDFAASTNELVKSDNYKQVADARAVTRQFAAKSKLNQIDLVDFATRVNTKEAKALAKALKSCVKYNQTTITNSYGISMYFPYETTKTVKNAIASYDEIGKEGDYSECMDEYTQCIKSFASLGFGGQIASSASQSGTSGGLDLGSLLGSLISSSSSSSPASSSPIGMLGSLFGGGSQSSQPSGGLDAGTLISLLSGFSGRSMPEELDWVDTDLIAQNAESIANQCLDPTHIVASEKNGQKVLALTEEEWALIETVELSLYAYDGEGYLDLGLDNTVAYNDDGDLILDFDGTWLTLNGHACAYYMISDTEQEDGTWVTIGRIPALLNGELVNLQVVFDKYNEYGAITGAYPMYNDGDGVDVQAKGDTSINVGDTIQLICDFYTPNGDYNSSYTLGKAFKVTDEGFTLENLKLTGVEDFSAMYRLTDIYGNYYWLPIE